jgi:hypothetical protein
VSNGAGDERPVVLRSSSGLWIVGVAAVVSIALMVDSAVRGYWMAALVAVPILGLIVWVFALVLVFPRVILTTDALTVVNIVRRHEIPWELIDDVTLRFQVRVRLKSGRTILCWGAPTAGLDRVRGIGDVEPTRLGAAGTASTSSRRRERRNDAAPMRALFYSRLDAVTPTPPDQPLPRVRSTGNWLAIGVLVGLAIVDITLPLWTT